MPQKPVFLGMALELLQPGCMYHIYNHAVGKDNLFLSDDNYQYFLRRYQTFIAPVADTYVYCLMPNHLHFLVDIKDHINRPAGVKYDTPQYISKQFSNLFSSYAQAFNKQQNRRGNLFISRFKRRLVNSDEDITNLIRYIHLNPVHHGFTSDFRTWKYSSYGLLCSEMKTFIARSKVIDWFGNLQEFQLAHEDSNTDFDTGLSKRDSGWGSPF